MIIDILKDEKFIKLQATHTKQILEAIYEKTDDITIVVMHEFVVYEPPLDQKTLRIDGKQIRYRLMNYSLSSLKLLQHELVFEAGFGPHNNGHMVYIPYKAVAQIIAGKHMLHLNTTSLLLEKERKISSKDMFKQNKTNSGFFQKEQI